MVGSVFSPYYARARRHVAAEPENHCAINVVLYGPRGKRWALTERGANALQRTDSRLIIGPSSMHWDGQCLCIDVNEITVPWPGRLRGIIRLHPKEIHDPGYDLDGEGGHQWRPIAPRARVEVEMHQPSLQWRGDAYWDANHGLEPLERRFANWNWSRAVMRDGDGIVTYDKQVRGQGSRSLAIRFHNSGEVSAYPPSAQQTLPVTPVWRMSRATQCDGTRPARVVKTLEDTPFYARSLVDMSLFGEPVIAMHESLSLDRFRQSWVQCLLPFRMPRNTRWSLPLTAPRTRR